MRFSSNKNEQNIKNKYQRNRFEFEGKLDTSIKTNNISLLMKISVSLSNVLALIGLVFTAIGLTMTFSVLSFMDLSVNSIPDDSPIIEGELISVNPTNTTINEKLIYEYNYIFNSANGKTYSGASYLNKEQIFTDNKVQVKYNSTKPENSCIIGMETSTFPVWMLLFVIVFPIIGFLLLYFGVKKGIKNIRILQFGKIALGTYNRRETTNASVNNRPVYKFYFDFIAHDNNSYIATGETYKVHKVRDEEREPVIYNSVNPEEAVIIDTLPRMVRRYFKNDIYKIQNV